MWIAQHNGVFERGIVTFRVNYQKLVLLLREIFQQAGCERGFSGSARPDDGDELAAFDLEIDTAKSVNFDLADAITGNRMLDLLDELRKLGVVVA